MALAADFARAQDGQIFSAWSDMMGEMKCFRNITTSGSSLITTVIGSKMLQFAAQHTGGISRFVSDTKVARKFAEDLTVFEEVGKPLKATLQGDFRAEKDILEICRVGGEPLKQMLVAHHLALRKVAQMSNTEASEAATSVKGSEENSMPVAPPSVLEDMEAIKLFNFDSLSEKLALEYGEHFRKPMSTWNEFTQAFPEYYSIEPKPPGFSPSVSAMLQASVVSKSSNFRILYKSLFTCLAQVRLARLALLVKAWRLDHADALPDALEQLIPDYTFALPIDPFDGKPLRYDKSKRLLWSISKSLEDGKFHFEDIVQVIVD